MSFILRIKNRNDAAYVESHDVYLQNMDSTLIHGMHIELDHDIRNGFLFEAIWDLF